MRNIFFVNVNVIHGAAEANLSMDCEPSSPL